MLPPNFETADSLTPEVITTPRAAPTAPQDASVLVPTGKDPALAEWSAQRPPGEKNGFWKGMKKPPGSGRPKGAKTLAGKMSAYFCRNVAKALDYGDRTRDDLGVELPTDPAEFLMYMYMTRRDPFFYVMNRQLVEEGGTPMVEGSPIEGRVAKKSSYGNVKGFLFWEDYMEVVKLVAKKILPDLQQIAMSDLEGKPLAMHNAAYAIAASADPEVRAFAERAQAMIPRIQEQMDAQSAREEDE